jgi:uncharacterized RDD family membrane protein YckC
MGEYGGFWLRVVAYIIDAILIGIVTSVVGSVLGLDNGMGALLTGDMEAAAASGGTGANLVSLAIGIAYFAGMESSSMQATLGKKALGMVVTDVNGNRISFLRGVGRYLAKILSALILLIGFIMVAFTERKQGLHDMLAGTLVYKGHPPHRDPAIFE